MQLRHHQLASTACLSFNLPTYPRGGRGVVMTAATAGLQKPVKQFNALLKNLLHPTTKPSQASSSRPPSRDRCFVISRPCGHRARVLASQNTTCDVRIR